MKIPIDKEWFAKRAAAEGDHEIGAGGNRKTMTLNLTHEEIAELERLINPDRITLSQGEVKALLYGEPKHDFTAAMTRLAAWLAEFGDTDSATPAPQKNVVGADIPLIDSLQRHVEEIGHTERGQDITAAIEVIKSLSHDLAAAQGRARNAMSDLQYWRDQYEELAALPSPTDHVVGWQSIDTAPTEDGFLAANATEVWAAWHYDSANWHARYGSRGATHWMPLPAPPALASTEGAEG